MIALMSVLSIRKGKFGVNRTLICWHFKNEFVQYIFLKHKYSCLFCRVAPMLRWGYSLYSLLLFTYASVTVLCPHFSIQLYGAVFCILFELFFLVKVMHQSLYIYDGNDRCRILPTAYKFKFTGRFISVCDEEENSNLSCNATRFPACLAT